MTVRAVLSGLALALAVPQWVGAVECAPLSYAGNNYTVCKVSPETDTLEMFLNGRDGEPLGSFNSVQLMLRSLGRKLVFAMNAGMYHEDRSPVGHYVENGTEQMRVIRNASPGNFGMLPNGVLCVGVDRADVIETRSYLAQKPDCRHASQSGPMLVVDGDLHPRFFPQSASRFIRNGVGTSSDGRDAYFVISDNEVTFHEFASLFRNHLKTPNALFLDGNVSRLYSEELGRVDPGRRMGPIVGVSVPISQ